MKKSVFMSVVMVCGLARVAVAGGPPGAKELCQDVIEEIAEECGGKGKFVADKVWDAYDEMVKQCDDYKECNVDCRKDRKECFSDVAADYKHCKAECKGKGPLKALACRQTCIEERQQEKADCREARQDCRTRCAKKEKKQCTEARADFLTAVKKAGKACVDSLVERVMLERCITATLAEVTGGPAGGSGGDQCKKDSDCKANEWCDAGLDNKSNQCRAKLDKGEVCGAVGAVGVGHRCKSGECKVHGAPAGKLVCQ